MIQKCSVLNSCNLCEVERKDYHQSAVIGKTSQKGSLPSDTSAEERHCLVLITKALESGFQDLILVLMFTCSVASAMAPPLPQFPIL